MNLKINLLIVLLAFLSIYIYAQESSSVNEQAKPDSLETVRSPRLQIGGYGEAVMQRMFYSDDVARYSSPERYKNGTHGRFDLPHVVFIWVTITKR